MIPPPVQLNELLDDQIGPLVEASELEGFRFVRRVVTEWRDGKNTFSAHGEALLGSVIEGRLVGIGGLMADPYANDARIGRLRNLYVLPAFRGCGIGAGLTREIIQRASSVFQVLRLRAGTRQAARLYEREGFSAIGGAPECTHLIRFPVTTGSEQGRS